MSSHHHMGRTAPNGEIEHTTFLSEHIGALYLNDEYSDVVVSVDGHRFHGHKVILAARSDYFRALLFGGLRESKQDEIELKGTNLPAFKALWKYIYTGHMSLAHQKEEVILETLGLAHQYGFVDLEASISDYLRQVLQILNVCMIYDAARLYQLPGLTKVCCSFMDKNAQEIIHHESFLQLSPTGLKDLIQRDSFYAPEVEIFCAVVDWVRNNQSESIDNSSVYSSQDGSDDSIENIVLSEAASAVLSAVRLPLMSLLELLTVVRPTNLIPADTILDAIASRNQGRDTELRYRGCLMPEENMAHPSHGTQVLQGGMRSALLDGDSKNYDMERGYTRHAINEEGDEGILIKLGTEAILNHFKMLLWDKDVRSYQYYIEVSMDQKDWVRVIDHTRYFCRSWQFLYFEPRVIRYIRIVGTNNTVNKVFHVVSFEAMYTNTQFTLEKGLIVPKHNVATVEKSASVIEGVSRSRNTLLNGDTSNYDWDSGYTCHQLGSGSILVQLGQPYMLDSMRLLLWDCDDRSYGFYVEVAVNPWEWEVVVDKSRESCRSWVTLHFERRPVVFIRIVGTHNTANEVFHCVHFETPAQTDDSRQQHTESSGIKYVNLRGGTNRSREIQPPSSVPPETASEAGETQNQDRKSSNSGNGAGTVTQTLRASTARAADFAGLGAVGGVGAGVALGAEAFDVLDDGGAPARPKRLNQNPDNPDRGGSSGGAGNVL
ncbi:BTB/POZ domain-containing protein 9 [Frankliniella occidentalis]|uniref:BTB/POZ domain-containing protein 9 n=1 Tax=Frankliniella occidentalis TaxID=133901 RepID=A0A6J1T0M3_FRAOC|nr:BTB/POZ domain-containing protein 9 [Frankliniella occidentalis]XP_052122870.1 BTB/POZ domain-containing protein 9 [Frankliniella occidentalis]